MRINAVFEHAKDFSDKFRTHSVWIKLLSMTDLLKAIQESLNALERLGEPVDLSNIDYKKVCDELVKCKEQFSGEREKKFSSLNHMVDCNKMRAMKIMSSLTIYYHQTQGFLGAFISCKMIQMSMEHGHCEDSVFGTAAFASALVNILEDINAGSDWGRAALSLKNVYDKKALVPSLNATIYGIVLVWKEPLQSTLEPLAEGIRLSYASGNVEFAMANIAYFIGRSFFSGKSIPVLMGELKALARQHGNHFGSDASGTHIYSPLLQFFILPLYNVLRLLEGDKCCTQVEEQPFPLDRVWILNNDEILKSTLEAGRLSVFHIVMSYETIKSFLLRDMDSALKCANLYFEHFLSKSSRMKYGEYHNMFFEALITLYFMRKTGEDHYLERGNYALKKFREWAVHSGWNFNNMLFLVEAEFYNTKNNFDMAAKYYEASIKAAREHKFIQEEAIASECAGTFFLERGLRQKAHSYLKHSLECYEDWGAFTIAKRVTSVIQNEFGSDSMRLDAKAMMPLVQFH